MNKPNIKLRDPSIVMKLSRLGSFHQSKLSFLRSFIREFKKWNYKRNLFDLDKNGFAVREAKKSGIQILAIADTNNDPSVADYIIPANDDSVSSIKYITDKIKETIKGVCKAIKS